MLKKDLEKLSKKRLVQIAIDYTHFVSSFEKFISHDIYRDIMEEMFKKAYENQISKEEFFGAIKFSNAFNKRVKREIRNLYKFDNVNELTNKGLFFGNWYTPIDIFIDDEVDQ